MLHKGIRKSCRSLGRIVFACLAFVAQYLNPGAAIAQTFHPLVEPVPVQRIPAQPQALAPVITVSDLPQIQQASAALSHSSAVPVNRSASFVDTAVICAPELVQTIEPWVRHRRKQGHGFAHINGLKSTLEIQVALRRLAAAQPLRYVVIFGDADPRMIHDPAVRKRCVPTFYAEAQVNTEWGSEPHIASDNPYADLNNDHVPDLAVGRISFDTVEELQRIVKKIIDYESLPPAELWRRRVHMTAGIGGFGALADTAIEVATKKFITDMLPAEYAATLTHGNWKSPYCPDPRMFRETVLKRVESGGLFWVYMGHGYPHRLDRLSFGDAVVPIVEEDDVRFVRSAVGPPIAVLLACYTGAYDQDEDCFAERLVQTAGGPVAAIAGSRVTMPYGMAVFGTALMDGYFERRMTRLGDIFLYAKRALASNPQAKSSHRKLLDTAAKALSPVRDNLHAERTEHQLLFQLFGDPLLVVSQPQPMRLDCRRHTTSGSVLRITGLSPFPGKCLVELVCRRDRLTFDAPRRSSFQDDTNSMANMMSVYAKANDRRWTGQRIDVTSRPFAVDLQIPKHAHGSSYVRVFVQGKGEYAMASSPVFIDEPESDSLRTSNAERRAKQ